VIVCADSVECSTPGLQIDPNLYSPCLWGIADEESWTKFARFETPAVTASTSLAFGSGGHAWEESSFNLDLCLLILVQYQVLSAS
jgi:hypothetical protein